MGHPKRWSLVYQALSFLSQLASASRLLGMTWGARREAWSPKTSVAGVARRAGFPFGIGCKVPRSQKRDPTARRGRLGHPSIAPFDFAVSANFVGPLLARVAGWLRSSAGELQTAVRRLILPSFREKCWPRQATVFPAKLHIQIPSATTSRAGSSHRSRST